MAKVTPEKFKLKDGREVLIRSPEPEDWWKVKDWVNLIKVESQNTFQFPGQPELMEEATRTRIQSTIDSKKRLMMDVEFEERFIGQLDIWPVHMNEEHPWLKHNCRFGMSVLKDFWGLGLGKKLLELMEREAKKMGYIQIQAEVRERNERGVKLYTNFGFEITGRLKKYAFIDGKYCDDLLIFKEI